MGYPSARPARREKAGRLEFNRVIQPTKWANPPRPDRERKHERVGVDDARCGRMQCADAHHFRLNLRRLERRQNAQFLVCADEAVCTCALGDSTEAGDLVFVGGDE